MIRFWTSRMTIFRGTNGATMGLAIATFLASLTIGSAPAARADGLPSLTVTAVEPDPVMTVGPPGSWDSEDVLNPSVVQWHGMLYNYYSGFDGQKWSTGIATSNDGGLTWTKKPNPILVPTLYPTSVDPYLSIAANGGAAVFRGQVYYVYNGNTVDPHEITLRLATSADGERFTKRPISSSLGQRGSFNANGVADPYLLAVGDRLFMYFEDVNTEHEHFHEFTGVAASTDGIAWHLLLPDPILPQSPPTSFDAMLQGEPAVIKDGHNWHMPCGGSRQDNYRGIGWAASTDGIHWTRRSGDLFPPSQRQPWFSQTMCDPTIIRTGPHTYVVWFGGGSGRGNQKINGRIGRFTIVVNPGGQ